MDEYGGFREGMRMRMEDEDGSGGPMGTNAWGRAYISE